MAENNQVQHLTVDKRSEGQRLDNFLIRELKGLPRARVYRLIRKGEVRVNKKRARAESKLELGDIVRIPPYMGKSISEPGRPSPALAERLLGAILFEDDDLLAINKPAGLAVHGGSGIKLGLVEAMRQLEARWQHIELVHRLDRETSGCLLIAKNANALKSLQGLFKQRKVLKTYHLLIGGHWPEKATEVDLPLRREQLPSGERRVRVDKEGKSALTRFTVLRQYQNATLMEALPETGRTHQIRVHCAATAKPIVGDPRYGDEKADAALPVPPELLKAAKLCLHAQALQLQPPWREQPLLLEADYEPAFIKLLEALKSGGNTAT